MQNFEQFNEELILEDLVLVDSYLPKILSHALIISNKYQIKNLSEVLYYLVQDNPLAYDQSLGHKFYEHKIKKFLSESVLKVMPNILWSDTYFNTTDYMAAKENGIVKYHIINRRIFEDGLLVNTTIENSNDRKLIVNLNYKIKNLQFEICLKGTFE